MSRPHAVRPTPQCDRPGCAGTLLLHLRALGCVLAPLTYSGAFTICARTPVASLAMDHHNVRISAHANRIAMLLWAEAGGRN